MYFSLVNPETLLAIGVWLILLAFSNPLCMLLLVAALVVVVILFRAIFSGCIYCLNLLARQLAGCLARSR